MAQDDNEEAAMQAEADAIAAIVVAAMRDTATRAQVRAEVDALAARVDDALAQLRDAMTAHVDNLDAAEREREEARREAVTARAEAVRAESTRRHVEEEAARLAYWRETRLVDTTTRLVATGRYIGDSGWVRVEAAVEDAATIIALCEAHEAKS